MTPRPKNSVRRIALVGGGRWARVTAAVLLDITPATVQIDVYSAKRRPGLPEWIAKEGANRVDIREPPFAPRGHNRPDAVIVANAPRDHAAAAIEAITADIPTLVEKPLSVSKASAEELVALAQQRGVFLGVSRVLLFARYIEAFADEVRGRAAATNASFVWKEPKSEVRYGAVKRQDPGVPVSTDVLPHILPILQTLFGASAEFIDLAISNGGMQTDIRLEVATVPSVVSLARNADARRRIIDLQTPAGPLQLDFSQEPGVITADRWERNGDPAWDSGPRPLARMLQTFLDCAASGVVDERLSAARAIAECHIADQAVAVYRAKQAEWLALQLDHPVDESIRYAVSEVLATTAPQKQFGDDLVVLIWAAMRRLGVAKVVSALHDPATQDEELSRLLARSGLSGPIPA